MEPFHPVRTRTVAHDVLHQIVERIKAGELVEGDLLPSERILASQMDVSRPTVRAAIERLEEVGVVQVTVGRAGGARIASIWIPEDLEASMSETKLSAEEIFGLLEARRAVETRVAQLAALRGTGEHWVRMEESIVLLRDQREDVRQAAQAEALFHRIMWQAAGNRYLAKMLTDLHAQLDAVHDVMLRTPEDYSNGVDLHEATLLAVRRGDPQEIEAEMTRHLGNFEAIVEDVLQQRAVRQVPNFLLPSY